VHAYQLKTVTLDGLVETVAEVPGRPSGLGFLPDGRLLMATALDRKLLSVASDGVVAEACDLSELAAGLLNDMVVDGRGRAYVGDTGFNMGAGESPRPGRVLLWTEGDSPRVVAEDVVFPNGCIVTPDEREFVIAETMANRISRFAIQSDGSLTDREVFAELGSAPDGLCLDADGGVWAGLPHESAFVRLGPDGRETTRVASPYAFAVTCALGGRDRRTLFLCSADTDLQRLSKGDTTGRIDALQVDPGGLGWP
jgi:sugar lactone lactonase YvrE